MPETKERWQYVDLPKGGRRATMGGSKPPKRKRTVAAQPKGKTKNLGTPVGDFADFLRYRMDNHFRQDPTDSDNAIRERVCQALKKHGIDYGPETVRKWEQGAAFPTPTKLGKVAKALGYSDWFEMVDAIRIFRGK